MVFVLGLTLPGIILPLLGRLGVIDIPNERSSHSQPAIRGVGLATALALAAGSAMLFLVDTSTIQLATVLSCLATALVASVIGLIEDVRGIAARDRALLQAGIGLAGAAAIVTVVPGGLFWVPLGMVAIAAYINVANFMDGVDGISGIHGVVVGLIYAVIGVVADASWLVLGGSLLAVAFLGFVPWNVLRGRMFLGDVGSYLLGAMVAALAFAAFVGGISAVALTGPVAIYLTDTGTTLLRRIRRGEPWFEAHRTHAYQRMTDRGLSHVQVALVVGGLSLLTGVIGLMAIEGSAPLTALSIGLIAAVAAGYVWWAPPRRSGDGSGRR